MKHEINSSNIQSLFKFPFRICHYEQCYLQRSPYMLVTVPNIVQPGATYSLQCQHEAANIMLHFTAEKLRVKNLALNIVFRRCIRIAIETTCKNRKQEQLQ